VDTPENQRLASQSKLQSQVAYHAEYEKMRGQYTETTDTPEMNTVRANSALSQAKYASRPNEEPSSDYSAPPAQMGGYGGGAPPQMGGGGYGGGGAAPQPPRAGGGGGGGAPPPRAGGKRYRAQFAYEATDTDEVSFGEGDVIVNAEIIAEGWMKGTVESTGQTGLLPSNYVEAV